MRKKIESSLLPLGLLVVGFSIGVLYSQNQDSSHIDQLEIYTEFIN